MAFKNQNVTVGTSAVRMNVPEGDSTYGYTLAIKVPSGGETIYLGPADVDTTSGYPVEGGETFFIDLTRDEHLYAVAAADQQVYVLAEGV